MKINPITKTFTTEYNACKQNQVNRNYQASNNQRVFSCDKTIVKNTLKEFSNSRGNYLADIDLTDAFIKEGNAKKIFSPKLNVKNTLNNNICNENKFLADMSLCDFYELPKHTAKSKTSNISFGGPFPQYLIDQDAVVESYEVASNAIQDIANSTYCSFSGKDEGGNESIVNRLCAFIKKILPI